MIRNKRDAHSEAERESEAAARPAEQSAVYGLDDWLRTKEHFHRICNDGRRIIRLLSHKLNLLGQALRIRLELLHPDAAA